MRRLKRGAGTAAADLSRPPGACENRSLTTERHAYVTGLASPVTFLANYNKTQPNR
jgi:hypothetical protein